MFTLLDPFIELVVGSDEVGGCNEGRVVGSDGVNEIIESSFDAI